MELQELSEQLVRCSRCGTCQSVCPVFRELQLESAVARGKVWLARGLAEGQLEITPGLKEKLSLCLLCGACVESCGSGVKVDKIVQAARRAVAKEKGLPLVKKLAFRLLLANRWVFDWALRSGSLFQGLLFRPGPRGEGMLPRLPLGLDRRRLLAPLAPRPLRLLYPEVVKVENPRLRVAFFTGCLTNYIYTDTGAAVIEVLRRNGVEVVLPRLQHCCGTPARVSGDYETAVPIAKANIDVLLREEVDYVVVACASCGAALKEEYALLLEKDATYREKARALGRKVRDFSELAVELGVDRQVERFGYLGLKVTYHDPCHLGRAQKVRSQPRALIRALPGVIFEELSRPGECCGSAGSFSLEHYDLAARINDRKIADIRRTQAHCVVTSCPACRMHIADGLSRNNYEARVLHVAQLVEMAYRAGEQGAPRV